ncbi:nucleoid-associated protein [Persephonella sp.]
MGDFRLNHLIVHLIEKKQYEQEAHIKLRENVIRKTPSIEALAKDLAITYRKSTGKRYSKFKDDYEDENEKPKFKEFIDEYLENQTEDNFIKFSKKATRYLKEEMESKPQSVGGYLLFIDYTEIIKNRNYNFISVIMVKKEHTTKINDETLDIIDDEMVNFSKIEVGGFIDINKYREYQRKETNDTYISLLPKSRDLSDYFSRFMGAINFKRSDKENTENLINCIIYYPKFKELSKEEKDRVRKKAFDFIQEKRKKKEPIKIIELANHIYPEDPQDWINYIDSPENPFKIDSEIQSVNTRVLKKLKNLEIKDEGIDLKFDISLYGNKIELVENNSIIIRSLSDKSIKKLKELIDAYN